MKITEVKKNALKNYSYKPLFFKYKGREHLIFPKKYGKLWWKKATKTDILRISVR